VVAVYGESVTAPGTVPIDAVEVVELARALIRIDTSNPPGNEQPGMLHLGADLERSGIEVECVEVELGRANLCARLPGAASSGHVDVVAPGDVP
jgi:succinyl-diaminopimelate desuccinylase